MRLFSAFWPDPSLESPGLSTDGPRERLGVYQDGPFRLVGERLAPDPVDLPFLRFVSEVAERFDECVVFARVVDSERPDSNLLLPAHIRAIELPDYGNLRRLLAVARSASRTARSFWRGLEHVDVVWAFGPHPFELLLVTLARVRGKRVVLGVRQDTPAYFRARLPSARWKPILGGIRALDALNRLLARRLPATVVGAAAAERYAARHSRVLTMRPSLVRAADVVQEPADRDWSGEIGLLTVGRVDTEKNPFLLLEAFAELERAHPGRYRLRWVGTGPMTDAVLARAAELELSDRFELAGYIPFGPELLEEYRRAHAFVHVSLTEGVPQVLVEALASGAPVIATDVGGIGDALEDGRAGLLVPPANRDALVAAILRLTDDAELRTQLVTRGLELARDWTLEAEATRVAAFLRNA
jgi:glycosyltransferase involved in cell wall biosynthesis